MSASDRSFGQAPLFFAESDVLPEEQLETSAQAVRNVIEQRRQAYRKAVTGIVAARPYMRAFEKLRKFDAKYSELAKRFEEAVGGRKRDDAVASLWAMEQALLAFEDDTKEDVLSGPWGFATQQAADYVANKLRDELTEKFAEQVRQIETAAKQLLAVKTAAAASGSFDAHVLELAKSSRRSATWWLVALIAAWSTGLFAEVYVLRSFYTKEDPHVAFAGGTLIAAAVVFLLYFVHGQHKVAKMMAIKYDHLRGLVGGGAVNLIEMLGSQEEFRRRVLERLAESFMSLDDVTGVLSKIRTPAEDALEGVKELTKALVAAKKATE